jgi:hypothetical protein
MVNKKHILTVKWKDGLLHYDTSKKKCVRKSYEKVCLKYYTIHKILLMNL